ncbi:hypothetical protein Hac_0567 [Helicobacter acinonychis str. Sheeba]|uniref:Uncharacterized protein n=1 Tax=Helicobacter acinonychis (strain Sheeba) TaxID=382638 RepID=Q17Y91_HELAH|nr:hypothetical protein Hac_0567 [Helicobacter acinonychis str. Sheeba]
MACLVSRSPLVFSVSFWLVWFGFFLIPYLSCLGFSFGGFVLLLVLFLLFLFSLTALTFHYGVIL